MKSKALIDPKKYNYLLSHFIEEIVGNPYYNQTWVWCNKCNKKHNVNSEIAYNHKVKPIPINCKNVDDHCWKYTGKDKFFGIDVLFFLIPDGINYFDVNTNRCAVYECFICQKMKMSNGYTMELISDLRELELKNSDEKQKLEIHSIIRLMEKIKKQGIEGLKEVNGIKFDLNEEKHYRLSYLNEKMIKIQKIENFIIEE